MAGKLDNGFLLLYDWVPAIQSLPGEDVKLLILALIERQRNETPLPHFDNEIVNIFAKMIEPTIQRRLDGKTGGNKANEGTTVGTTQGTTKASKAKISREKADKSNNTAKQYNTLSDESVTHTREKKSKYGEYGHVLLTDEEFQKLHDEYANADEAIAFLDEYIEYKGYKAKNHYLAMKKWVFDALKEREGHNESTDNTYAGYDFGITL